MVEKMSEKQKKVGRPASGVVSKRVTINMPEAMAQAVEAKALSLGLSVSAYIVKLLQKEKLKS
jgi:predicted HicB family RNase H-like nuclease